MKYSGFCIINLANKVIECVGLSDDPDDYEPGVTNFVPNLVDPPGVPTIPPTPPVVRRVLYFTVDFDGEIDADFVRKNLTYINPLKVSLNLIGSVFKINEVHEEYDDYKKRIENNFI